MLLFAVSPMHSRQTMSSFLGTFQRECPTLLQSWETAKCVALAFASKSCSTHSVRVIIIIFPLLFSQSQWFLPVPWGIRACCSFQTAWRFWIVDKKDLDGALCLSSHSGNLFLQIYPTRRGSLMLLIMFPIVLSEDVMEVHEKESQSGYKFPHVCNAWWFYTCIIVHSQTLEVH